MSIPDEEKLPYEMIQALAIVRNAGNDISIIQPDVRVIMAKYAKGEITQAEIDVWMSDYGRRLAKKSSKS